MDLERILLDKTLKLQFRVYFSMQTPAAAAANISRMAQNIHWI